MLGRSWLGLASLLLIGCVHARDAQSLDERELEAFCARWSPPQGVAFSARISGSACFKHHGPIVSMGDVVALGPRWSSELTVDGEGVVLEVHRVAVHAAGHEDRGWAAGCLERALMGRRVVAGLGQPVRFTGTVHAAGGLRPEVCPSREGTDPR